MYTDEKNAQIVLSLLKQYGVKKIVISPGTTNVPIARSVQIDDWFEVYSVVDERSAAYFATGLAYESGEPVVISCTGATASRNYLSGLTEAFYRNLPVIALTSQRHAGEYDNLVPQVTDRRVSQNDVKKLAIQLPVVKDEEDFNQCVVAVNRALISSISEGGGPVHVNLPMQNLEFNTKELPAVRKIEYYPYDKVHNQAQELHEYLLQKKIAIFIGAHHKFDKKLTHSIETFVSKYDAVVIVDHTSGYKGKNRVLLAQISDLKQSPNRPDLVIDMGSITGEYSIGWLDRIETWRLSEDGQVRDRLHAQHKLFDCKEFLFFEELSSVSKKVIKSRYYDELRLELDSIEMPELPLSNTYVSHSLSRLLPKKSNLHLGILNSLRNMNLFELDPSIETSSNVGGFGIDGALSTLIGISMVNKKKLSFGLLGDLAAFYDMNALGIRHIEKNLRIVLINNNGGIEFRLNKSLEDQLADETNEFISASGHNGSMAGWAQSMGFHYISAQTKAEFNDKIKDFCSSDINKFDAPVMFEVFTDTRDEQAALDELRRVNGGKVEEPDNLEKRMGTLSTAERTKHKIKAGVKRVAPQRAKNIYKKVRGRD